MVFVSATRLHLRSLRFLRPLVWLTSRVNAQIRSADGCLSSAVSGGRGFIFWTKSVWRDEAAMHAFMSSGAHMKAMPRLKHWCDEASAAHWSQESAQVSWADAQSGMARHGWISKVLHPSPAHAAGLVLGSPK